MQEVSNKKFEWEEINIKKHYTKGAYASRKKDKIVFFIPKQFIIHSGISIEDTICLMIDKSAPIPRIGIKNKENGRRLSTNKSNKLTFAAIVDEDFPLPQGRSNFEGVIGHGVLVLDVIN